MAERWAARPWSSGSPPATTESRSTLTATPTPFSSVSLESGGRADLHADLWLWTPQAQLLRPTFPGATIAGATFLADGRIALTISLPPDDERQTWLLDDDGGMRRLGPAEARGPLAVAPDGGRVAYAARGQDDEAGTGGVRPDEVWIAPAEGDRGTRAYVLTTEMRDERLVDLSWAPDGRHLFLVTRYQLAGGGYRTRLLWLDAATRQVDKIANIPSEVVPGSYGWSPTGEHVAFLARSGQTTVALPGPNRRHRDPVPDRLVSGRCQSTGLPTGGVVV